MFGHEQRKENNLPLAFVVSLLVLNQLLKSYVSHSMSRFITEDSTDLFHLNKATQTRLFYIFIQQEQRGCNTMAKWMMLRASTFYCSIAFRGTTESIFA